MKVSFLRGMTCRFGWHRWWGWKSRKGYGWLYVCCDCGKPRDAKEPA